MRVKKQQLELDMGQLTGSKLGKEYKPVYCYPPNLSYAEHIMQNAWLYESEAGIRMTRRNMNNLKYADDTTLVGRTDSEAESGPIFWPPDAKS